MIDNIFIIFYFLLIAAIGLYNKRNKNLKQYSSIGKLNNPKLMLVATIFSSSVGGGTTFGLVENIYNNNLAYSYALLATIPIDILIAVCVVPKLFQYRGLSTVGDIISKSYGQVGCVIAGISVVIVSVGYIAAQINVSGKIFQYLLGWNPLAATIISYIVVIFYTSFGGLRSVVIVNFVQFIAMVIAIPLITIMGLREIGITELISVVPVEKYALFSGNKITQDLIIAILSLSLMGFYPTLIQRIMSQQSSAQVTRAIIQKSVIYAIFIICISINGLLAIYYASDIKVTGSPVLHLITEIVPIGLQGVAIIGFLAAAMSTSEADLNILGISLMKDVVGKIYPIKNTKIEIFITQCFTALFGILAIWLALIFDNPINLVVFASSSWSPVIVIPLIGLLFDIKISTKEFIICVIVTVLACILTELNNYPILGIKTIFIGTFVHLILFTFFYIRRRLYGSKKYT
ncbi:MAG: sodium:solute symporter family protein [Rickettsiaceae bacterium]|nr:sodium:solute symporter family protein [Rickettsiaceae bacterium]